MRVLHLGGNELGDRILHWLREREDVVHSVVDLPQLRGLDVSQFDWIVSAGFRHMVPENVLQQVSNSCNVHTSYLPWGRGAHPNVWAIAYGEPAGVSIHVMTAGLDEGPIYAQRRVHTTFGDVGKDLYDRLQESAYLLFVATWPNIRDGNIDPVPQPSGGSYHESRDLSLLAELDLDEQVVWRHALDILRALTFPPYKNLIIERDGKRYHVEIDVTEIVDD